MFSSPFIEERLYLNYIFLLKCVGCSVLVPFYRGAVVFYDELMIELEECCVLVPFYRGAVVFKVNLKLIKKVLVLVPFYRGAVVFKYHGRNS